MQLKLASEEQLVLLLARGSFPSQTQERARSLLVTSVNWDLILELVTVEEVYPIVYRNLKAMRDEPRAKGEEQEAENALNGKNAINAINAIDALNARNAQGEEPRSSVAGQRSVFEQLGKLAKINAFRSALLVEELARVLRLLSEAGIPAIPLKGPALAQDLYGDQSLRTCVDLDILVPRSMVRRAFDLLRADGYKSEFCPGFFSDLLLHHDIEYGLRRDDCGFEFMVELHWGVLWGGKAEESIADQLWADAYPTIVFGAPAYALRPEWQVLFLAAHAGRHRWQGLKWLVDLHELYSTPKFDWDNLLNKAKQLGWEELLRISFLACDSLFETPIPHKYLVGDLPAWVKLFPEVASPALNGAFFATRLMESLSERAGYIARVLFVPTLAEYRLLRLPSFFGFLYYAFRPLRLMCKWSWAALRGFAAPSLRGQRSEVSFELEVRSRTSEVRELRSNS